jgi:hypothetical protein
MTPQRIRRWATQWSLLGILQEGLGHFCAPLTVGFVLCMTFGAVLGVKGMFELMIPTRLAKQVFNRRRRVIGRRCVDSDDTLVAVELKSGPEFQSGATLRVHGDEMEAVRGNLNHELLQGAAISAREERGLASVLGKKIARGNRQHPGTIRLWWGLWFNGLFNAARFKTRNGFHRSTLATLS